jgi:hypothetical protein
MIRMQYYIIFFFLINPSFNGEFPKNSYYFLRGAELKRNSEDDEVEKDFLGDRA